MKRIFNIFCVLLLLTFTGTTMHSCKVRKKRMSRSSGITLQDMEFDFKKKKESRKKLKRLNKLKSEALKEKK